MKIKTCALKAVHVVPFVTDPGTQRKIERILQKPQSVEWHKINKNYRITADAQ